MSAKSLRKHAHHVDKRLRFRLRIYFFISVILIGILLFNIARGSLLPLYGIIGLAAGIGIGIITSRMYHISWNHDAKKVVGRLDIYGVVILIFYIAVEISREKIVNYFTHGFQVGTIALAILAGMMFGQFLGTRGKVLQVLKEEKVFGKLK